MEDLCTSGSAAYSIDEGLKVVRHPVKGEIHVTPKELELLAYLHKQRGRVVSALELLKVLWNETDPCDQALVRVNVRNLRRRAGPDVIETNPKFGYFVR